MSAAAIERALQQGRRGACFGITLILVALPLRSEAEAIDLMRFSRIGDDARIEIELGCEMQQGDFRGTADGLISIAGGEPVQLP